MNKSKEVLTKWINAMVDRDWKALPDLTQITYKSGYSNKTVALHIQSYYIHYEISSWTILEEIAPEDKCLHTYKVQYETNFGTLYASVNVIQETEAFQPSKDGTWGVNPISALPVRKRD